MFILNLNISTGKSSFTKSESAEMEEIKENWLWI